MWANLVAEALGRPPRSLGFEHRPAVSQIAASSTSRLDPFARYNAAQSNVDARIRPFNFILSANVASLGHPPGVDPTRFHLIARYERDASRWLRMRWLDRYSGRSFSVTTGPASGEAVRLKSIADVIAEYRTHPEAKSLGPDGRPCGRDTLGLLGRRPVRAAGFVYIGKEANELDEVEEGLVHDLGEVLTEYGQVDDPWTTIQLPLIRSVPTGRLAAAAGVDRKTVQRTKAGATRPHPATARRLCEAAQTLQAHRNRDDDREAMR